MKCPKKAWKYKQVKNSRNYQIIILTLLPFLNLSLFRFPTPQNTRWALMLLSHLVLGG